jgi:GT2 family glycosyltransferase
MSVIAVVILNYNGKVYLEKFLPGVVQYSPDAKIIVADNGSNNDSLSIIPESVEVIRIEKNLGFCGGYNYALSRIDADYFVLLNNDVEVTKNWLTPLKDLLDKNPAIAAVQPKILSYRQKDTFEYAGAGGGFIDALGYPFCRGRIFDTVEKDQGQYNDTVPVFWATGACLMIRAKLYKELGGLDEDFFAHMEEIDMCWRLKRRGYQVYYCGLSTVFHVGGGTLSVGSPAKTYYNFRNGLSLLIKHEPAMKLLWKLPFRIFLDWVAALKFLVGQPSHAWAICRAHFYTLIHLRKNWKKRVNPTKPVPEVYPGLMIWKYFVLGKKTYQ